MSLSTGVTFGAEGAVGATAVEKNDTTNIHENIYDMYSLILLQLVF